MNNLVQRCGISDMVASQSRPSCFIAGKLAIPSQSERTCGDAQPVLDAESLERFCQTWAEVGRAILLRRKRQL